MGINTYSYHGIGVNIKEEDVVKFFTKEQLEEHTHEDGFVEIGEVIYYNKIPGYRLEYGSEYYDDDENNEYILVIDYLSVWDVKFKDRILEMKEYLKEKGISGKIEVISIPSVC